MRADSDAGRPTLVESLAVIEARRTDLTDPARRHAAAARAWLHGDSALALERYGAMVVDRPRDILALALSHALDFRLGRRRMLRDHIAKVLPEWSADVMHAIVAFAAAGKDAAAGWAFGALPRGDGSASSQELLEGALAQPLCLALLAFAGGAYDACVI